MHFVLFCNSPREEMNVTGLVSLHLKCAGFKRPLFADQDMEVIICSVQSGMALRAKGSSKDDEIFRDGRVDDVHGTHGASGVVEDPFRGVGIDNNNTRGSGVGCGEVRYDVLDHAI